MMKKSSPTWFCSALMSACLAALASSATAQALTAPAYAGAWMEDFQIQLIDLDPEDGVTPWISFTTPGLPNALYATGASVFQEMTPEDPGWCCNTYPHQASQAVNEDVTGAMPDLMSAIPVSVTSLDGTVTASMDRMSMSTVTRLTNADISQLKDPVPASQYELNPAEWRVRTGGYAIVGSSGIFSLRGEFDQGQMPLTYAVSPEILDRVSRFDVSAHTRVVFSGKVSVQADLMPEDLQGFSQMSALEATTQLHLELNSLSPTDGRTSWMDPQELKADFQHQQVDLMAAAYHYAESDRRYEESGSSFGVLHDGQSQDFMMTFVNPGSTGTQGAFSIDMDSNLLVEALPVPEPATWALMGLGLVGIGVAARRRPAQA